MTWPRTQFLRRAQHTDDMYVVPILPPAGLTGAPGTTDAVPQGDGPQSSTGFAARLAVLGLAAGFSGARFRDARKRRFGSSSVGNDVAGPRQS